MACATFVCGIIVLQHYYIVYIIYNNLHSLDNVVYRYIPSIIYVIFYTRIIAIIIILWNLKNIFLNLFI